MGVSAGMVVQRNEKNEAGTWLKTTDGLEIHAQARVGR